MVKERCIENRENIKLVDIVLMYCKVFIINFKKKCIVIGKENCILIS